MRSPYEGGCLCGALRYRITLAPHATGYCHCRLCQRSSGAPALAWASVPLAGFEWVKGEPRTYRSSEHGMRQFCGACGTQILYREIEGAREVDVNVPTLDDPSQLPPDFHIWTASRIRWFDCEDDLPRYPGERSEPDA